MMINKILYYDNLNEFWLFAMRDSNAYKKDSRDNNDLDWYGGLTWKEAKKMAISGWREGMLEIEKYRAKIAPIITEKVLRIRQTYSISGYNVDVGAYLSNEPECFISREYEERNYPGKIFKLVASISFSAAISPETIIQRGAMICALIDAIEYAGHRVEVVCNNSLSACDSKQCRTGKLKNKGWFEIAVNVKKANQPLEMTDLAFTLAHPAMLRRIMFSVAELEGWSDFIYNYGYPAEATDKGDIYIKEIFSGTVSDEKAINWVLEELKNLNINIETK